MEPIDLLDQGYAWTSARIAVVSPNDLDAPTPCTLWNLQQLLDHTIETLAMLTDGVAGEVDNPTPATAPLEAIADLASRSRRAWQAPAVMDRTYDLPVIGTLPGPVAASVTLLECVVHGWDISQATGEAAEIPDALALPTLDFVRVAVRDESRGDNFAADLGVGDTPSDQLVAYLGRKPR